jgi:hypothetical protein
MAAGYYSVGGFRTLGTAATPQNLMTIENIDATKLVFIRSIVVQMDATAVLTSVTPQVKLSRATGVPTGGTALNKGQFSTSAASNANTIVRCGTASDGGAATAITATAGTTLWQQYIMRMHTVVGQVLQVDLPVAPSLVASQSLVLAQNQALLVQVVAAAGASNPATNHYIVNICWEED